MLKNGIINLIGQIFKVGSSILITPILINILGLQTFGLLSWSTAILAAVQIAEGGLSSGLLYYLSEKQLYNQSFKSEKRKNEILTSGIILLIISTVLVIIILFLASPIFVETLKNISRKQREEAQNALLVGSFLIGIKISQSFFWAILQSNYMYKTYSAISTIQIIATNFGLALTAYLGERSITKFIILNIIISLSFTVYLFIISRKVIPSFKWKFSRKVISEMFKYNFGVLGSNFGSILFSQGDKLIIAHNLGVEILSVYTIFTNLVGQLNQFAAQATHPLIPIVSSISQNSLLTFEHLRNSIKQIFLLNVYISLGGAGIFIILGEPILSYFLNNNFSVQYIFPFQILALIYGIYTLSVTGYYIMLGLGKSSKVMTASIIAGVLTLVSMYYSNNLLHAILSNSFFFLILILLFQGMRKIGIELKDWAYILVLPLIVVISLTFFLAFVTLNFNTQIILSILFSIFLSIYILKHYGFNKMITSFTMLFKQ
ncbi:oligosaccharide flippase family protein [Dyadobacter frigoris]|uniref:Polysaccharide biosynthesis protein C-terminal domain-containing protein n=1 Tax=Dyadobacter frigoris TaxID=2576211 RepID=A0A4V6BJ99_9BACT|nr:oligosaccharide flippase family protein [Dyadobacter frigoris]TKT93283.1 hypothetical protein FDK13_05365 [Dyadobacter frigoris]